MLARWKISVARWKIRTEKMMDQLAQQSSQTKQWGNHVFPKKELLIRQGWFRWKISVADVSARGPRMPCRKHGPSGGLLVLCAALTLLRVRLIVGERRLKSAFRKMTHQGQSLLEAQQVAILSMANRNPHRLRTKFVPQQVPHGQPTFFPQQVPHCQPYTWPILSMANQDRQIIKNKLIPQPVPILSMAHQDRQMPQEDTWQLLPLLRRGETQVKIVPRPRM